MPVATHIVKINGKVPKEWKDKELEKYTQDKLKLVNEYYDTDTELIHADKGAGEVWVFFSTLIPTDTFQKKTLKWLGKNAIDTGVHVDSVDVEWLGDKFGIQWSNE